jgi:DNA-binding MarR family transcriptional regulator
MEGAMSRAGTVSGIEPVLSLLQIAEAVQAARQRRAAAFPQITDLMDGPAWDILLAVFIANRREEPLMVTVATDGTSAARTTALRHLQACQDADLIIKEPDPHDRRKLYLKLSSAATRAMSEYLQTIRSDPALAPIA